MKTMREKFEGLEKIKDILDEYKSDVINFDDEKDEYEAKLYVTFVPEYIEWLNGAWYAFQEQQKKIDKAKDEINNFFDNQTMTPTAREYANKLADILEILNESQQK